MKLYRSLSRLSPDLTGSVVTIGNFDGLHIGHQQLISTAKQMAKVHHVPAVVMTFSPNPRLFFRPSEPLVRLQRLSEKYFSLKERGVDILLCVRFDASVAMLTAPQFVQRFLVEHLKAKAVVIGDDFRFGVKRSGDEHVLRKLGKVHGFDIEKIPAMICDGARVSSSRVRDVLQSGDMQSASRLLGRPYSMTSRVVYGDQRGRQWGFPTANLPVFRDVPPVRGIFAVQVEGEDFSAQAVASIGFRPVFAVERPLLEVFILDFDRDIYGQRLKVEFLHKIRDEANFPSVEALIERMHLDVALAREFFSLMP